LTCILFARAPRLAIRRRALAVPGAIEIDEDSFRVIGITVNHNNCGTLEELRREPCIGTAVVLVKRYFTSTRSLP